MRVFVTGGTGLLGNTVLRQLHCAGHDSLALVRGQSAPEVFEGTGTTTIEGDLLDASVIQRAVKQCDAVIHSAGLIHLGWKQLAASMRVNRDGTKTIVDACLEHQTRLIHVGTVDTLALGTAAGPSDETTPLEQAGGQVPCNYVLSKRAGVAEVTAGVERGLDAVIVHPGFMFGPWDWKPSSGRMLIEVGRGWKPVAPSGGCSLCDSRDVANTAIDAIEADVPSGRQFILAGENVTYLELWREIAQRMDVRPPAIPAGPAMRWIAGAAGDAWARLASEGDVNSAAVRMSSQFHWHDSTRARQELGYRTRPVAESLDASAAWVQQHFGRS